MNASEITWLDKRKRWLLFWRTMSWLESHESHDLAWNSLEKGHEIILTFMSSKELHFSLKHSVLWLISFAEHIKNHGRSSASLRRPSIRYPLKRHQIMWCPEAHSKPRQISKMDHFAKIVNGKKGCLSGSRYFWCQRQPFTVVFSSL